MNSLIYQTILYNSIYMKRRLDELTKQEVIKTLDALYTASSVLKGRDETKRFLRDLLTESERIMLGRRILIARYLLAGITYDEIMREMKVGRDTIARVEQWMMEKSSGYRDVILKMRNEFKKRDKKRKLVELYKDTTVAGEFARLKRKYPLHFLLFPWPDKYKDINK